MFHQFWKLLTTSKDTLLRTSQAKHDLTVAWLKIYFKSRYLLLVWQQIFEFSSANMFSHSNSCDTVFLPILISPGERIVFWRGWLHLQNTRAYIKQNINNGSLLHRVSDISKIWSGFLWHVDSFIENGPFTDFRLQYTLTLSIFFSAKTFWILKNNPR